MIRVYKMKEDIKQTGLYLGAEVRTEKIILFKVNTNRVKEQDIKRTKNFEEGEYYHDIKNKQR